MCRRAVRWCSLRNIIENLSFRSPPKMLSTYNLLFLFSSILSCLLGFCHHGKGCCCMVHQVCRRELTVSNFINCRERRWGLLRCRFLHFLIGLIYVRELGPPIGRNTSYPGIVPYLWDRTYIAMMYSNDTRIYTRRCTHECHCTPRLPNAI